MKIYVSQLIDVALDWAVTKCEGQPTGMGFNLDGSRWTDDVKRYSTDWAQAGPIIEREGITVGPHTTSPFIAHYGPSVITQPWKNRSVGPTYLVSAMRCFVEEKLGSEIDIPEELLA